MGRGAWAPLYLKRASPFDAEQQKIGRDVIRIDSDAQIDALDVAMLASGYSAQRCVNGRGVGVEVLAFGGEIPTAFQHERLHEPPASGASTYRRSMPLNPVLVGYSRQLMSALRYTGAAMVEFKVARDGSEPYLMEIKGRLWGSLPLTVAAGLDIPLFWYEMLRLGRRQFSQTYRTPARFWEEDIDANIAALHSTAPSLIRVPMRAL